MIYIIRLLITSLVAYILSLLLQPHVLISSYGSALIFVFVLGLLNVFVKPLLFLLTLPVTILTLGLFYIVLNVLMILLADYLLEGIRIENFWWALLFGFMLSFFSTALQRERKG